jgi:hypothetical protein
MGIALGEKSTERSKMGHAKDRMRQREKGGRSEIEPFHRVGSKMLVQPGAPSGADAIARLQYRPQPRARSTPDQPEMTAMLSRHQFEDGIRLPMALDTKHDPFIAPLHPYRLQMQTCRC